jgi:hypothetical protein
MLPLILLSRVSALELYSDLALWVARTEYVLPQKHCVTACYFAF